MKTNHPNESTCAFEEGQRLAEGDIKKLLKQRRGAAHRSGDPDEFWRGYYDYIYDFARYPEPFPIFSGEEGEI